MIIWVFVEGEGDRLALQALWSRWLDLLRDSGHGVRVIPLDDKSRFFRKIGHRAAEKLANNDSDLVIGLPDLYPNKPYDRTRFRHVDVHDLRELQRKLVNDSLVSTFHRSERDSADILNDRFCASSLKHDCEMLLLAADDELRSYLKTTERLVGNWRQPVEDQDQERPPKHIVEELVQRCLRRKYRETTDARAVLGKVDDISSVIFHHDGSVKCPVFRSTLDWIGERVEVPAYRSPT